VRSTITWPARVDPQTWRIDVERGQGESMGLALDRGAPVSDRDFVCAVVDRALSWHILDELNHAVHDALQRCCKVSVRCSRPASF